MKRPFPGDVVAIHVAQVGPAVWGRNGAGGVYSETALRGEADILGHLARRKLQFGASGDNFCEQFELRAYSGEKESRVAKVDTPYRSLEMSSKTTDTNGGRDTGAQVDEPDYKWAVVWLVNQSGQRRAAEILGVDRKTVALALRRERLTPRMNHAVQTLLAHLDDPVAQEVMPLDRIDSQIKFLLESIDELDDLIDGLTLRVEALEVAQARVLEEVEVREEAEASEEAEDEVVAHDDEVVVAEEHQEEPAAMPEPEPEQTGRRFGWWRR